MEGQILMSAKEINRVPIIERLVKGELKAKKAAEVLNLSIRQVRRLKLRYLKFGARGLTHKSRGRQSCRIIPKDIMEKALSVVKEKYGDFGPTLALEKLTENDGVTFSRETLRKAMIAEGIWRPKKKSILKVFQIRERRSREGELVQADASPHAWFEDRGDCCNLLVFIDDATGKLKYLQFVKEETTDNYLKAMYTYITNFGKPMALYVDKHSVFKTTRLGNGTTGIEDTLKETQFTRAMRELSIEVICANSPQAKGRVEKANDTLQDRLVKELRLKGVNSMQEGNKYLPFFMKQFNEKFGVGAKEKEDAHRPLLPGENLKNILIKKEVRILSKNLTFQYKSKLYQIAEEKPAYTLRYAPVEIHEDCNEKIRVYYKGKNLTIRVIEKQPLIKVANSKELTEEMKALVTKREIIKPSANHPWRRFVYR